MVPTVPSQARSTPAAVSFATNPVGGAGVSAAAAPNTEAFDRSSSVETGAAGVFPRARVNAEPGRLCEYAAGSMAAVLDSVGDVAGVRPAARVDGGRSPGERVPRSTS